MDIHATMVEDFKIGSSGKSFCLPTSSSVEYDFMVSGQRDVVVLLQKTYHDSARLSLRGFRGPDRMLAPKSASRRTDVTCNAVWAVPCE